jgi:hypothetical protein
MPPTGLYVGQQLLERLAAAVALGGSREHLLQVLVDHLRKAGGKG